MAPTQSRQLLIWSIPTLAVILSYFWYRRRRIGLKTDPGDTPLATENPETDASVQPSTPNGRKFSRSLSGVDSAPIDIIIPPKLKSVKSNPIVISDEDLDQEIEKIKSMRYSGSVDIRTSCDELLLNKSKSSVSPKREPFTVTTPKKIAVSVKNTSPMAQKLIEESLPSSSNGSPPKNVEKSPGNQQRGHDDLQRQNSERDSANHSPADVMLASPSLSSISDNQSEGSNDSGKGGSEVVTPPPSRTTGPVEDDSNVLTIYEFVIPQSLVGKLIGKNGSFVTLIKNKTGAHVVVKKHPTNNKLKVCVVEGSQKEIGSALKLVRDKFPLKRFPDVTLEQVSFVSQAAMIPLVADHLYLKLIEGINNDTIVSCMVAPNHLFLQQPTHPTFPNLNVLSSYMNACYSESDSPLLPSPIPENTVCAAYSVNSWYRAMILSTDEDTGTCYVKFLDYGGYAYVENTNLRQIRGDFMLLPFQAAECFLANIKPVGDSWHEDAYTVVADLTKGAILYTQIADFTPEGVPIVLCYLILGNRLVFLNEELVSQGHAEWVGYEQGAEASASTAVTVSA